MSRLVIRKSVFQASSFRADSIALARAGLMRARSLYPDAAHNCWAVAAGPPGSTAAIASSDDGEPRGTAGRPMLAVLMRCGIGQIGIIVTRWFGGVKLGVNGLVHAYQDACLENLKSLPVRQLTEMTSCLLTLPYARVDGLRRLLQAHEGLIEDEAFTDSVCVKAQIPADRMSEFRHALLDFSKGDIILTDIAAKSGDD